MTEDARTAMAQALERRFGDAPNVDAVEHGTASLAVMAQRGSCRSFADHAVDMALVRTLCAVALASPTKSDLQQRDIVIVAEPETRAALDRLVADQAWVAGAPAFLVFCGNNRRQRQLHDWRGHPFANDHLDAFFNAAVDAGIALATFVVAAEAAGLGCCPVSAVRNRAQEVSDLLGLPSHVFPVAGLGLGWPAAPADVTPRLPLDVTVHTDRFSEDGVRERVGAYDRRRECLQPYRRQRRPDLFGEAADYGWSEDKARQYALPERSGFGAFVRAKGFDLG